MNYERLTKSKLLEILQQKDKELDLLKQQKEEFRKGLIENGDKTEAYENTISDLTDTINKDTDRIMALLETINSYKVACCILGIVCVLTLGYILI